MNRIYNKVLESAYVPLYCILIIALLTIYLLYDNQFNKSIKGVVGAHLPFRSVGDRGHIFFTDKEGAPHLVASTHFGYNLNISPLELRQDDLEEIYEHLNEEIDIDREDFLARARKPNNDEYEVITKDLSKSVRDGIQKRITNYGLTGVWLESFKKREYIHGSLGAHVVGFVSVDSNDATRGQYGIENIFDDVLSVSNKTVKSTGTVLKEQLNEVPRTKSSGGGSVFLSIDINAQRELEVQLKDIQKRWEAKKVGGIIMNPYNGMVVAMGAVPTFNPNTFNTVSDYSLFNNPNIEDVYEMGSVFKALTLAIALDSGRVSPEDTYNDTGSVVIDGRKISNYDKRGRGPNTPIQTIISQSLNTGAVFLLEKTTVGIYKDYIQRFRFNDVTRIDLPKEVPGLVSNLNSSRTIEFATASYGHGIAVTPIAAIRAFASLANGGLIIQPYVVSDIQQSHVGGIITAPTNTDTANIRERKRVFKESTVDQVTEYLIRAYDRGVLGGSLRNTRYSIAAKTGTAQLVDPKTGKYAEGKFLHSFVGYFPARNPEYIIFLYAVDPQAQFASDTLARPFSALTKFLISYYAIPPDR